jgi:hypothetical protein
VHDSTTIPNGGDDVQGQVVDDNAQQTTNAATEAPLPYDQVFNNRNQDVHDQSDEQRADDTVQQTSNAASATNKQCSKPGKLMTMCKEQQVLQWRTPCIVTRI